MENLRHRPTVDAAATAKKQNENEITAAYVIACIKHHSGCSRSVRYPNGNLNEIRRVCALLVVGCLSHAWRRVVCATKAIGARLKFFLYSIPICPLPIDVCPLSVVDASHTHTSYQKSTIFFLAFASRSRPFAGWWKCVHFSSGKCSTKATRRHTKKLIDDARIHGVSARTANGENTATDLHNYSAFLVTYLCTAAHSVARHTHTYTHTAGRYYIFLMAGWPVGWCCWRFFSFSFSCARVSGPFRFLFFSILFYYLRGRRTFVHQRLCQPMESVHRCVLFSFVRCTMQQNFCFSYFLSLSSCTVHRVQWTLAFMCGTFFVLSPLWNNSI